MHRRAFLKMSAALPALATASHLPGLASIARAQPKEFDPRPGAWRTFEVTTRVEVLNARGLTRVELSDYEFPSPGLPATLSPSDGERAGRGERRFGCSP